MKRERYLHLNQHHRSHRLNTKSKVVAPKLQTIRDCRLPLFIYSLPMHASEVCSFRLEVGSENSSLIL